MLVFMEKGKPENPEENPLCKTKTNDKLNPLMAQGWNQTLATLVGGENPHLCAIPASPLPKQIKHLNVILNTKIIMKGFGN